jgi:hypothetical protein
MSFICSKLLPIGIRCQNGRKNLEGKEEHVCMVDENIILHDASLCYEALCLYMVASIVL